MQKMGLDFSFGDIVSKESYLTFLFETTPREYFDSKRRRSVRRAFFLCTCGNIKELDIGTTKRCGVKTCGCILRARGGLWNTPEYNSWQSMLQRCNTETLDNSKYYIKKGVKVCERWSDNIKGFHNFLEDMGNRPEGCSLDRIDPSGDYNPTNCRWASYTQQSYNQRIASNNTSGCTGVRLCGKVSKRWAVTIRKEGKTYFYGYYDNLTDAITVRIHAEKELYGYSITLRDRGRSQDAITEEEFSYSLSKRSKEDSLKNLKRNKSLTKDQESEIIEEYLPYVNKKAPNGFRAKLAESYAVSKHVIDRTLCPRKVKEFQEEVSNAG